VGSEDEMSAMYAIMMDEVVQNKAERMVGSEIHDCPPEEANTRHAYDEVDTQRAHHDGQVLNTPAITRQALNVPTIMDRCSTHLP